MKTLASFLKRIVQRLSAGEGRGSSREIFTAAFGKHPGWDDHIDDIGLDTHVLIAVKRTLYIRGIGRNIDTGAWEKLEREQQAEKFGHVFVWLMGPDAVVGRLWPSRDGKGRTSYPMVVCVQCSRSPLPWVFANILPRLERIETACRDTESAEDVRRIVGTAQNEFRQLMQQCEPAPTSSLGCSQALARLAALPHMGPDRQSLHRVLYHIDREVAQGGSGADKHQDSRPISIRVPVFSPASREDIVLWISFLKARFGAETPILALMPLQSAWIDMVVGEPTDAHLFCLRASLGAIPLTSSIPYHMDTEFVAQVNRLIDDSPSGTECERSTDRH